MRSFFFLTAVLVFGVSLGCGGGGGTSGSGASGGSGGTGGATGGSGGTGGTTSGSGGSGATGGQGGTGGGASGEACNQCVGDKMVYAQGTSCGMTLESCQQDATCANWLMCTQACIETDFTFECFEACDADNMEAAALYNPMYACTCGVCASECSAPCD